MEVIYIKTSQKFFRCRHCGNFLGLIHDACNPLVCCNEQMEEQKPNLSGDEKKHYPQVRIENQKVTVQIGEILHPMTEEHHISLIYLETKHGGQRKCLEKGDLPVAEFSLFNDEVLAVFTYCNLHGLWKKVQQ